MTFFRPEFFNRLDAVVTFDPLSPESIRAITLKELEELPRREGLIRANIRLQWTEDLVDFLAASGFDRRYGARPLQRAVERLVATPLACYLAENPRVCDAVIRVFLDGNRQVRFQV